jgi:hypothetical protein
MPSQKSARKPKLEHGDSVKIVPLHVPEELRTPLAAAAGGPQLTYRKGPLITAAEVFVIFWGAAWQQAAQSGVIAQLNQFFDFVLTSAMMDQMAEYSVTGQAIGHGKRTGTITVTTPSVPSTVHDSAIQSFLQQQIAGNSAVPKPGPNVLYFLFFPPGVKVVQGGSASCQAFCGYHNDIGGNIFYAVMPYPNCQGCTGGLAVFDALTSTTSHELCEAITDPVPGQGWYDDANGEIGDICAWKTKKLGNYTVQLEWSNKANACV